MRWVFSYLKPLRSRIFLGISVKIVGTVAELNQKAETDKFETAFVSIVKEASV